uniref:type II secretion system F family protein n=1 Tax=Acetatifactor sp. TaxID=1872090 RepID=UPI004057115D
MNVEQLLIDILPFVISILVFVLILIFASTYHPQQAFVKTYERVNNRLREKKNGIFNYERTREFLQANGAEFHYGKWIDPVKYLALRLILAALLFFITIRFHWFVATLSAILGYQIPGLMLVYMNRQDNEKMLMEVQTVYNALFVLIKAGVYVSDAMAECYTRLKPGRLRSALEEISGELFVKNSFDEAIKNFQKKFNNSFIDSLCIILLQGKETGKTVELLQDISEQIKEMNATLLRRKKDALEHKATFCILAIFAAVLVVVLYALVTDMFASAGNL